MVVGDSGLTVEDLVGGDTACLDGGVPDLHAVLDPEGEHDGELLLEVTHLILADPARGDSSHVFAAGVRLSFDLSVHRCGLSYHLHHLIGWNVIGTHATRRTVAWFYDKRPNDNSHINIANRNAPAFII